MRFRIEFSAEAERDFALIFDHLFESYRSFVTCVETALDHCQDHIREIGTRLTGCVRHHFTGRITTICCRVCDN